MGAFAHFRIGTDIDMAVLKRMSAAVTTGHTDVRHKPKH
jgi:hypothetical protein